MKNIFYFLSGLLFLFIGCNRTQSNNMEDSDCESNLDSIQVVYFKYRFDSTASLKWISSHNKNIREITDTIIRECAQLKEIEQELIKLYPQKDSLEYLNARMSILVYKKNGMQDSLTINDLLMNTIHKNGIMQIKNNKLVYLIRKYTGYYSAYKSFRVLKSL